MEELIEKMCDEYCKYPEIKTEEELMDICESCPLNILLEEDDAKERSKRDDQ